MDVWHAFQPCLVRGGLGTPPKREQHVPPALHGIHDTGRLDVHAEYRVHLRLASGKLVGAA